MAKFFVLFRYHKVSSKYKEIWIKQIKNIEFNIINKIKHKLIFDIIDPSLDLEMETGGDSRFSVFLGSKSKFTG